MPTEAIRLRELEVAEKNATASAALAVALQAVAETVRAGKEAHSAEHEKHSDKIDNLSALLLQQTAALEARGALWARTLEFLSAKPFLVGLAIGVGVTIFVLGPFIMASFAPALAGLGAS